MQLIALLLTWLIVPPPPYHLPQAHSANQIKPNPVSAYAGAWVGRTGTREFTLVLEERKNYRMANGQYYDVIVGRHAYIARDSAYQSESLSKPADGSVLFGIIAPQHPNQLSAIFTDKAYGNSLIVSLSFVAGDTNKLEWQVTGRNEHISFGPVKQPRPRLPVPRTFVLERIK